jgi:hypothetical protein
MTKRPEWLPWVVDLDKSLGMRTRTIVAAGIALVLAVGRLPAQDPFEIIVYPAATAAPGEWELETHLNYTARGTTAFDGSVLPPPGMMSSWIAPGRVDRESPM